MITKLEFLVLGSGTSAGVPSIGCDCEVCHSEDSRDRRLRTASCLRFRDGSGHARTILLDTSPDLRQQALTHKLDRCDGIFYTHGHVDHIFGLDEVRRFNVVMQSPIDIYAEASTLKGLGRVFKHIFESASNTNPSFVANLIANELEVGRRVDLFGLGFTPIRLMHGRLPILGFRIEALTADGQVAAKQPEPLPLAYCTDVSAIPPETWPILTGLETLILDMLRHRHHPTHLNLDQATTIADQIGASATWFVHMGHEIAHAAVDRELPKGQALAYDGLRLPKVQPVSSQTDP